MKQNKTWEFVRAVVTAFVFAFVIRAAVVQAYKIPSGSMIPTLLVGDYLLANKFIYGEKIPFVNKKLFVLQEPEKGDIVIFPCPKEPSKDFIKRVVAVEGDTVEERNKRLFINGTPVGEPFVQHTDHFLLPERDSFGPYVVPSGKVFVMGDNRDNSFDSRYWGYVDINDIKGKAFIIYWSWDKDNFGVRWSRIGELLK